MWQLFFYTSLVRTELNTYAVTSTVPPILINWNRYKWGLHSIVEEVKRWLLYFSYRTSRSPSVFIIQFHLCIWWCWYHLPWVFGEIFTLYHHIPDLHGIVASYSHKRFTPECMKPVTKTSHSLHMEKAENWSHYSLEQLKTMLAKDNGEDTKAYPDWRPNRWNTITYWLHWQSYPSNSHCVVQCPFISDADVMSNCLKSLSQKLFT